MKIRLTIYNKSEFKFNGNVGRWEDDDMIFKTLEIEDKEDFEYIMNSEQFKGFEIDDEFYPPNMISCAVIVDETNTQQKKD